MKIKKLLKYIVLFFILLLNSCASISIKIPDYIKTVSFVVSTLRDVTTLEQNEGTYFIEARELFIAPYSKVQIDFKGYCLSPCLPAPSANDEMVFSYSEPKIPLIGKIDKYILANPDIEQPFMQGLIWNLANKVKFENLSYEEQDLLLKVEPAAPIIIDSFLKEKIKGLIKSVVETHIPSEWRQIIFIIEGKRYDYKDYVRQMEELQKKVTPPETPPIPQPVDNTNIYGLVKTGGYSKITIEFYNPTGEIQKMKLNSPYIYHPRNKFQIRMLPGGSVRG